MRQELCRAVVQATCLAVLWATAAFAEANAPQGQGSPGDSRQAAAGSAFAGGIDVARLLFPTGSPAPEGDSAPLVEAAASVTKALRARAVGIRKGGEALVGKEVHLGLRSRTMSGTVSAVTDEGLVVASTYVMNGQQLQRPARVSWDSLSADQLDELAKKGGWEAATAERAIVRACAAFASGDL
ncbi:MAG: hypothetical protein NTW87_05500, partial [Planctomycetota bacterium]|nr:hypothetical protein [Planctomycetota bacterium]